MSNLDNHLTNYKEIYVDVQVPNKIRKISSTRVLVYLYTVFLDKKYSNK